MAVGGYSENVPVSLRNALLPNEGTVIERMFWASLDFHGTSNLMGAVFFFAIKKILLRIDCFCFVVPCIDVKYKNLAVR